MFGAMSMLEITIIMKTTTEIGTTEEDLGNVMMMLERGGIGNVNDDNITQTTINIINTTKTIAKIDKNYTTTAGEHDPIKNTTRTKLVTLQNRFDICIDGNDIDSDDDDDESGESHAASMTAETHKSNELRKHKLNKRQRQRLKESMTLHNNNNTTRHSNLHVWIFFSVFVLHTFRTLPSVVS